MTTSDEKLEEGREAFEKAYAERSGTTVDVLHAYGQRAEPCDCDEEGCEGWKMVGPDEVPPGRCPICKKRIAWYGLGEPPGGPCTRCQADLPRVPARADDLWQSILEVRQATVVRRREIAPTRDEDGDFVNRAYWVLSWRVPVLTKHLWHMLTYVERVPLDSFGNLADDGSIWRRIQVCGIPHVVDTSWTGSF